MSTLSGIFFMIVGVISFVVGIKELELSQWNWFIFLTLLFVVFWTVLLRCRDSAQFLVGCCIAGLTNQIINRQNFIVNKTESNSIMKIPYIPEKLPISSINWESHITSIGQANGEIARYDGILQGMVNPQLLLSPLSTREAVISSRIEGTQASLEEVLHFEANESKPITPEKRDDIAEIINYRRAIFRAVEQLKSKPICINSIRELHKILLRSARCGVK